MENQSISANLTHLVTKDRRFLFTVLSYVSAAVITLNMVTTNSLIIGLGATILYLFINATFIGQALFKEGSVFIKFMLGSLILVVGLGFAGWVVMILYNLDNIRTALVLLVLATFASILNRKVRFKNADARKEEL